MHGIVAYLIIMDRNSLKLWGGEGATCTTSGFLSSYPSSSLPHCSYSLSPTLFFPSFLPSSVFPLLPPPFLFPLFLPSLLPSQSGEPFTDPDFPPADKALYSNPRNPSSHWRVSQWLRPGDIRDPFSDSATQWAVFRNPGLEDIAQGVLGNCW